MQSLNSKKALNCFEYNYISYSVKFFLKKRIAIDIISFLCFFPEIKTRFDSVLILTIIINTFCSWIKWSESQKHGIFNYFIINQIQFFMCIFDINSVSKIPFYICIIKGWSSSSSALNIISFNFNNPLILHSFAYIINGCDFWLVMV